MNIAVLLLKCKNVQGLANTAFFFDSCVRQQSWFLFKQVLCVVACF
jgi:hypothetical protein